MIRPELMTATLHTLLGVADRAPLRFNPLVDLRRGEVARVLRLLQFLLAEGDHDENLLADTPVRAHLVESFATALVLALPHNHSRLLAVPPACITPAHLKRAEEFISANAREPISMSDLTLATGVNARALYAAFRRHHGCSPMEFLRARRYELARRELSTNRTSTVATVAFACGFQHLGRFSVEYRKRFGESPKQTLTRSFGVRSR